MIYPDESGYLVEDLLLFGVCAVVPVALLMLIRPMGRLVFFLLGLAFFVIVGFFLPVDYGPHNPLLVLPFIGLLIAFAAVVAEALVRIIRMIGQRARKRRAEADDDA